MSTISRPLKVTVHRKKDKGGDMVIEGVTSFTISTDHYILVADDGLSYFIEMGNVLTIERQS